MEECWLPVFGLEDCGYEVSNLGRVRSWRDARGTGETPFILTPTEGTNARCHVTLYLHPDSAVRRKYQVHRVVACTFMCPVNGRDQINHIDGNPRNNALANLEWCTQVENMQHAIATGLLRQRGHESARAKFTERQIEEIRLMRMLGASYAKIRERYPAAKSTISYIVNRVTYQ